MAMIVSGRASFEMVQKAWAGGFSALVAVSGPSALAVATARRAGMTVLGFARNGQATLYSPAELV
jgi:FdhD protein